MGSLKENIEQISKQLEGTGCKLVAVSKTKPISMLRQAYDLGIRDFGENKVQELTEKFEALPKDIAWHMIGHLQTNKVKYLAPFIALIHSVDSLKLLKEINKRAQQNQRVIEVLLQVHIAEEESKFGFSEEELIALFRSDAFREYQHVKVVGLMGMATFTDNPEQVRKEFRGLKQLFDRLKSVFSGRNLEWRELSMGMSGDYQIAIEEGSTMVRVGSSIFGERNYPSN